MLFRKLTDIVIEHKILRVCSRSLERSARTFTVISTPSVTIRHTFLTSLVNPGAPSPGTLSCEAGCSLKTLEKKARKKHLFFPVDLYIREAQIGGVVAADMAGPRTARYGNLHGNVLGLEVVSAKLGGRGRRKRDRA